MDWVTYDIHTYIYTHIYIYIYTHIYIHIYTHIYMHIYTYRLGTDFIDTYQTNYIHTYIYTHIYIDLMVCSPLTRIHTYQYTNTYITNINTHICKHCTHTESRGRRCAHRRSGVLSVHAMSTNNSVRARRL